MLKSIPLAAAAALLLTGTASAAITASATTNLNMRSGPGPTFPVMHVIAASDAVIINGCITGSRWCMVTHGGMEGWAYSDYLTTPFNGAAVVVGLNAVALGLATLSADALPQLTIAATPAAAAAIIAPAPAASATIVAPAPAASAVVPAPAPAVTVGAVAPAVIQPAPVIIANPIVPPLFVRTFIMSSPLPSVLVSAPIFVGATLPADVTLVEVPAYQYPYAYVNGQAILADPITRQIVYIAI
jgi:hypothetical protein